MHRTRLVVRRSGNNALPSHAYTYIRTDDAPTLARTRAHARLKRNPEKSFGRSFPTRFLPCVSSVSPRRGIHRHARFNDRSTVDKRTSRAPLKNRRSAPDGIAAGIARYTRSFRVALPAARPSSSCFYRRIPRNFNQRSAKHPAELDAADS